MLSGLLIYADHIFYILIRYFSVWDEYALLYVICDLGDIVTPQVYLPASVNH